MLGPLSSSGLALPTEIQISETESLTGLHVPTAHHLADRKSILVNSPIQSARKGSGKIGRGLGRHRSSSTHPQPPPQTRWLRESQARCSFLLFRTFFLVSLPTFSAILHLPLLPSYLLLWVFPSLSTCILHMWLQGSWMPLEHSLQFFANSSDLVHMAHSTWLWGPSTHHPPCHSFPCPPLWSHPLLPDPT